jgi:hypothetical protein
MRYVKLGAHNIGIVFQQELKDEKGDTISAQYIHNENSIVINGALWEDMPASMRTWVIVHEVMEAIKLIMSVDITHDDLDRLAEGMTDFLVNNQPVSAYAQD